MQYHSESVYTLTLEQLYEAVKMKVQDDESVKMLSIDQLQDAMNTKEQHYHGFIQTCTPDRLQEEINANAEFGMYLKNKQHKYRLKQDELCQRAIDQDTTQELECLLFLLGNEDWRHLVNANYVINRAITKRKYNILRYMVDKYGLPEAACLKTGFKDLRMLEFLHSVNSYWFDTTYEVAKYNNWTDVIEFMVNNGYTIPVPRPVSVMLLVARNVTE